MSRQILQKCVEMNGSQVNLATRLSEVLGRKIRQGDVWRWLNHVRDEETPPPAYVIPICKTVNWQITPHQLRPDIYPNPADGLPIPRLSMAEL